MSVQLPPFIGGRALGDSQYYARVRQLSTLYFWDHLGTATFQSGTTSANSKIPLIQDTFTEHTTLYRAASISTFGSPGACELTFHAVGSAGDIVSVPLRIYIDGGNLVPEPVALTATGLDAISVSDPAGVADTFPKMVVQLWRRFFKKATKTSTQIKTYGDDGTTVRTTQAVSDDGTTETQGAAT